MQQIKNKATDTKSVAFLLFIYFQKATKMATKRSPYHSSIWLRNIFSQRLNEIRLRIAR